MAGTRRDAMAALGSSPWAIATVVACGISGSMAVGMAVDIASRGLPLFWDFSVVLAAASATTTGSPYDSTSLFPFVYPPHVAALLAPLAAVPPTGARFVHASVTLFALVAAGVAQVRVYRLGNPVSLCFLVGGLSAATLIGWLTGNIGILLNAGILVSLTAACAGRFRAFYWAVLIAALVKPYALVFLALPVLVGRPQALRECAGVIAVCAAVYAGGAALAPEWFGEYTTQALTQGSRDLGQGGLSWAAKSIRRVAPGTARETLFRLALSFQLFVAATLLVTTWRVTRRARPRPEATIALATLVCILTLPRLKVYDLFMALGPILYFGRHTATNLRGRFSLGHLGVLLASLPMAWLADRGVLPVLTGSWTFLVLVSIWGFASVSIRRNPAAFRAVDPEPLESSSDSG